MPFGTLVRDQAIFFLNVGLACSSGFDADKRLCFFHRTNKCMQFATKVLAYKRPSKKSSWEMEPSISEEAGRKKTSVPTTIPPGLGYILLYRHSQNAGFLVYTFFSERNCFAYL